MIKNTVNFIIDKFAHLFVKTPPIIIKDTYWEDKFFIDREMIDNGYHRQTENEQASDAPIS